MIVEHWGYDKEDFRFSNDTVGCVAIGSAVDSQLGLY